MLERVRWFSAVVILLWSSIASAQIFQSQGPGLRVGPINAMQSADATPNGTAGGAIQAILPDPALGANTMFAASVNGGVFRTTDGGTTWTALTDKQASLSIARLGLDPADPTGRTIVAGVGITSNGSWDNFNNAAPQGRGGARTGLLYTTDGGASWSALGGSALAGQSVIGVAARGNTILAATFEVQDTTVTQTSSGALYGLYRSVTGGTSFSRVAALPGPVTSLVADPTNPARFYAAVTSVATPNQTSVYVTPDAGATWTQVFTQANSNGTISNIQQTVLTLAAGPNGSVAVAVSAISTNPNVRSSLSGVFLSQNAGGTWHQLDAPPSNQVVPGGQTPVNLTLAIDPKNANIVYLAGDRNDNSPFFAPVFRVQFNPADNTSTSISLIVDGTGPNFSNANAAHADSRAMAFDSSGRMLFASDGGFYVRSNPQGDGTWQGLNNFAAFEPYKVAFDANSKRVVLAAQDNGVSLQSLPGRSLYSPIGAGDGLNAEINDRTFAGQSAIYTSSQSLGSLSRMIVDVQGKPVSPFTTFADGSTNPGGVIITCNVDKSCSREVGATDAMGNDVNFSSPFVLNRVDATRIAMGGTGAYVTQDTYPSNAASIDLTLVHVGDVGGNVTSIAYGTRDNTNALVVGALGPDLLWRSLTAAAGTLETLPAYANAGGAAPTGIVFDARTAQRFFVADGINLWSTRNGTADAASVIFQSLTPNLPLGFTRPTSLDFISNNGVNALLVGGLNLPLACSSSPDGCVINAQQSPITVADSDASGNLSGWRAFGQGLPNALISTLSYNPTVDVLAAGAVGRGVFVLYDVTSNFPQATVLQFGLADNNSNPAASILTDGTALDGTHFVRPLNKYGTGTLTIAGDATYTGGTTILGGVLQLGIGGAGGSILGSVAFCSDATNSLCDPSTNKLLAFNRSDIYTFTGAISGPGQVAQIGAGTTILAGDNAYTGGTIIHAGALQVTNNNSVGTGAVTLDGGIFQAGANGLNFFNPFNLNPIGGAVDTNGNTLTLGGVIADGNGPGGLTKVGAGTLILTGANSYTGLTFVDNGILSVEGSIASSPVLVNAGATLAGTGTAGATAILSGGTLAPGAVGTLGTLTIQGNLAFQSGALYLVQVNPASASSTNVSGAASLAGTVGAIFLPGTYIGRSYSILTAAGGLTGTFDALAASGLPRDFQTSLSYTATTAFLNLRAQLVPEPVPPSPVAPTPPTPIFTVNQLNVGHAIDNFFNNGGALPPAFVSLFNLTGSNLTNALDQLSGEAATGAQKVAFQLTNQFLDLMLDPFVDGRSGVGGADHPALGFAAERENMPPQLALAYASVFKEPRTPLPPVYEPRWTVWGGAYGGVNRTSGDIAFIGSHDLSASTVGFAGGFDYRYTPDTVLGFAFAGGGTNWSLSQGLGGGKSDAFQAGIYGATKYGPAYLTAAFAFANHWMSTDRLAVGDHLTADFNSQSYGGRLEGGYRIATPFAGITPYAAIQAQDFHTPAYSETGAIPNGFALGFGSRDATDTRSELGARFDRVLAVYQNAVLALRGRVAWAHDWVSDPTLTPLFQALPGASFVVNGAALPKNSALTSAGAELRLANGITLLAKFDGEFASHSSTYGGTGTLRYRW